MGNGTNGSAFAKAAPWVALLVTVAMWIISTAVTAAKDTPTRAEMEAKIAQVEQRLQPTLQEISGRLNRIENLLLDDRDER